MLPKKCVGHSQGLPGHNYIKYELLLNCEENVLNWCNTFMLIEYIMDGGGGVW